MLPISIDIPSATVFVEEWRDNEIDGFVEESTCRLISAGHTAIANFIAEAGMYYSYGPNISVPTKFYLYNAYFSLNKLSKRAGGEILIHNSAIENIVKFREKDTRFPHERLSIYAANIISLASPNYYDAIDLILASTPQQLYKPSFDAFRDSWLMFFYDADSHPQNKFFSQS